jgi:hypothetical protein
VSPSSTATEDVQGSPIGDGAETKETLDLC